MSSIIKAAEILVAPGRSDVADGDGQPAPKPAGGSPPTMLARLLLNTAPLHAVATRRARHTLERAAAEAEAAKREAQAQRDAVLEEARREGYQAGQAEGREAGRAAAREEARQRLEALAALVDELARAREELAARYEEDIVELALAVAARIVRKESSLGADTVRELLRETLPRMGGAVKITITVHPDDMAAIEQDARQLASLAEGRAGVTWVTDEAVTRGGCVVETERGGVDASVETRVERIVESMLDVITSGA